MARLPRLAIAGLPHLVLQRGHNGQPVFVDDDDRRQFLAALREALALHRCLLHAYMLLDDEVLLLLTPEQPAGLSQAMQAVGRRYVAAFNQRHGRSGTLWNGRFRAAPLEAGAWLLTAMLFVETAASRQGAEPSAYPWSSAAHHLGLRRDSLISDASAYWQIGNTPFERESAWRARLSEGADPPSARRLAEAAHKGWALGGESFLAALAGRVDRPLVPRPRGRPPKRPLPG